MLLRKKERCERSVIRGLSGLDYSWLRILTGISETRSLTYMTTVSHAHHLG
jgi:hypothetical protein